ncbi:FAR1-related sequence 5-like protein [Tanacetum coccineum]
MTQAEKMFVVKAATNKIRATRAHNLLSSMKGGYEYVHGMTNDFKNHQRDVNVFIENSELVAMFWADEVAKYNYKEFGDIVSFDATFNSNKYNMKFVPFIGIDNHRKCVTHGSGMLLHEDTKSYTWLLKAFMTAFLKEPMMIVTDQDGAMKRAIKAVFTKAKHRIACGILCKKFCQSKDKGKMGAFIEKLKVLMEEVKDDVLNPPSRNTGDVIGGIFSISKPNQIVVQNPTKAINKGEHLKKGERLKRRREKALKVRAKLMKVCGYCNEKTIEHTKTTFPKNPKVRKKKATPIIDV